MNALLSAATLASIGLVGLHHVGYPLALRWFTRETAELPSEPESWPHIEIIIPLYNEAKFIQDKLWNLAMLDYPADRLRIHLELDGCTDNTEDLARQTLALAEFPSEQFELQVHPENVGKVALLNRAFERVTAPLVVVSDGSALVSIDALKRTASAFEDPATGVLTGTYQLWGQQTAGETDYWRYQTDIKKRESRFGGLMGAHGAFFAIRKDCFAPLPEDAINDDFLIAMQGQAQGYRGRYLEDINSLELEQAKTDQDARRRVRLAAGNVQQAAFVAKRLHQFSSSVITLFLMGKGIRPLMPFLMLFALFGSLMLAAEHPIFALAAAGQVLGYSLAALGALWPKHSPRIVKTLAYLVKGHIASAQGALIYLVNPNKFSRWKRA